MSYKQEFLEFSIQQGVLKFGEFTLKSGRISPYFFNAGLFNSGTLLAQLGQYYAQAIVESGIEFDMLFGPAYKGIPLAVTASIAFSLHHARDLPYAFDRKEVKTHGEGGNIIGTPLAGRVLIIDDVITAGTAVREAVSIIQAAGAKVAGVAISLDRQECGQGRLSAVQEVENEFGVRVCSIAGLNNLLELVYQQPALSHNREKIIAYRERYGIDKER